MLKVLWIASLSAVVAVGIEKTQHRRVQAAAVLVDI
jgi:hypothetical protein